MSNFETEFLDVRKVQGQSIDNMVRNALQQISCPLRVRTEELYIFMPEIYQSLWFEYLRPYPHPDVKLLTYRGIKVLPGYENKVVVSHKDAAIYNSHDNLVFTASVSF